MIIRGSFLIYNALLFEKLTNYLVIVLTPIVGLELFNAIAILIIHKRVEIFNSF